MKKFAGVFGFKWEFGMLESMTIQPDLQSQIHELDKEIADLKHYFQELMDPWRSRPLAEFEDLANQEDTLRNDGVALIEIMNDSKDYIAVIRSIVKLRSRNPGPSEMVHRIMRRKIRLEEMKVAQAPDSDIARQEFAIQLLSMPSTAMQQAAKEMIAQELASIEGIETRCKKLFGGPIKDLRNRLRQEISTLKARIRQAEDKRYQLIIQKNKSEACPYSIQPTSAKPSSSFDWKFAIDIGGVQKQLPQNFEGFKRSLQSALRKYPNLDARSIYYQLIHVTKMDEKARAKAQDQGLKMKGVHYLVLSIDENSHHISFSIQLKKA